LLPNSTAVGNAVVGFVLHLLIIPAAARSVHVAPYMTLSVTMLWARLRMQHTSVIRHI
jgi:hypothetical protein